LAIVKQSATSTVVKDMKPGASPWDAIGDVITHLIEESTKLVQPISEPENVIKSKLNPSCLTPNRGLMRSISISFKLLARHLG
jgi:dynactin 1